MTALGPYELEGELGRGAFGVVVRGRHRETGALHALKVIDVEGPEGVARFQREAEALARLGADGVVGVHEVWSEGRRLVLAMELMPGGSLRTRGRLDQRAAVELVAGLARTLERAHATGIVHRDVKPENVLFDELGRPRLSDFGCARDLKSAQRLTLTGEVLGTPHYMAPEQLVGEAVDGRADVWALGVILFELVAGRVPFEGANPVLLYSSMTSGARPRLPGALQRVIDGALEPDPARRLDAGTLARELELLLRPTTGARRPLLALALLAPALLALLWVLAPPRADPVEPAQPALVPTRAAVSAVPSRASSGDPALDAALDAFLAAIPLDDPRRDELARGRHTKRLARAFNAANDVAARIDAVERTGFDADILGTEELKAAGNALGDALDDLPWRPDDLALQRALLAPALQPSLRRAAVARRCLPGRRTRWRYVGDALAAVLGSRTRPPEVRAGLQALDPRREQRELCRELGELLPEAARHDPLTAAIVADHMAGYLNNPQGLEPDVELARRLERLVVEVLERTPPADDACRRVLLHATLFRAARRELLASPGDPAVWTRSLRLLAEALEAGLTPPEVAVDLRDEAALDAALELMGCLPVPAGVVGPPPLVREPGLPQEAALVALLEAIAKRPASARRALELAESLGPDRHETLKAAVESLLAR